MVRAIGITSRTNPTPWPLRNGIWFADQAAQPLCRRQAGGDRAHRPRPADGKRESVRRAAERHSRPHDGVLDAVPAGEPRLQMRAQAVSSCCADAVSRNLR
jgi:hypothetical protein